MNQRVITESAYISEFHLSEARALEILPQVVDLVMLQSRWQDNTFLKYFIEVGLTYKKLYVFNVHDLKSLEISMHP